MAMSALRFRLEHLANHIEDLIILGAAHVLEFTIDKQQGIVKIPLWHLGQKLLVRVDPGRPTDVIIV